MKRPDRPSWSEFDKMFPLSAGGLATFEELPADHTTRAEHVDQAIDAAEKHIIDEVFRRLREKGWAPKDDREVQDTPTLFDREQAENEYITRRLAELRELKPGWLDGDGATPTEAACALAAKILPQFVVDIIDLGVAMSIFPMLDGGVQAEWCLSDWLGEVQFPPDGEQIDVHYIKLKKTHCAALEKEKP